MLAGAVDVGEHPDRLVELSGSHVAQGQIEFEGECVGYLSAGGEEMWDGLRELATPGESDAGKKMLLRLLPPIARAIGSRCGLRGWTRLHRGSRGRVHLRRTHQQHAARQQHHADLDAAYFHVPWPSTIVM